MESKEEEEHQQQSGADKMSPETMMKAMAMVISDLEGLKSRLNQRNSAEDQSEEENVDKDRNKELDSSHGSEATKIQEANRNYQYQRSKSTKLTKSAKSNKSIKSTKSRDPEAPLAESAEQKSEDEVKDGPESSRSRYVLYFCGCVILIVCAFALYGLIITIVLRGSMFLFTMQKRFLA